MTNEQILEELRKLKVHNSTPTSEEQLNIENEVMEIDASIEEYNARIAELESKLSDSNNYAYNNDNEERTFTIELLQESFENQLEVMDREDAEYKNLQELATKLFIEYNNEVENLNLEIEAIERRLRKNEVAVKKNIGIKLSEEELSDLKNELSEKKARIATCEDMKEKYVSDLSNYGELITANNRKRELVNGKQNSLNRIIENRKNNPITVNKHQLRLDQDELSRLKSGVNALKSRKEYITYNPNTEIDKLINAITAENDKSKDNKENLINMYNQWMEDEKTFSDSQMEENPIIDENEPKDFVEDTLESTDKEKNTIIVPPIYSEIEDISSHSDNDESISEEEKEEDEVIDLIAAPSDLDKEREAQIEDAEEQLKEKKKDKKFVALWKKFSKKAKIIVSAAAAVGLTGVLILSLKSCNNKTQKPSDYVTTTTTTQTVEDKEEDNILSNINTTKPSHKDEINTTNKPTTPTTVTKPTSSSTTTTVTEPTTSTTVTKPTSSSTTTTVTEPTTSTTVTKPTGSSTTTPTTKPTETIKLEQGEKIASLEDILNGNINEDTTISHGDEVGKNIDGAELKDYTEDGNAEINIEKKEETEQTVSKTPEEIKKALEEFMGGEITFDNDENQWLDEIENGKTR